MLTTSATNSRIPCLDPCATFFTATSILDARTPRYTLPKPPMPRSRLSLNPSVAWNKSLYENLCGPNAASHSSLTSAYMRRRRMNTKTTAATAKTSTADAIGSTISSVLDRGLGLVTGRVGREEMLSAGAAPFILKLHPST
uniref:Uncharacterized protein n=1 Tax=Arundo donax TaxID=35708 RepID=A0A0A9HAF6_ARUDO